MWKFARYFVLCSLFLVSAEDRHEISKRSFYLMFPTSTVLQLTYGFTVPVVLPRRSINISWCYQAQYNLPFNTSNFFPPTIAVRASKFSFDLPRIKFYEYFAKLLNNFGFHGEECLYRSICEIGEIPMYKQKDESVLERIVEYVFTYKLYYDNVYDTTELQELRSLIKYNSNEV